MNIIVTNKYRDLIYSTNLEVLKELNGVFKVNQIVNSFNSVFYKKIIIDATALQDFPKDSILKELSQSFDKDKLILFLPPDNPPPMNFLFFLVSINIYNFTDNPNGLVQLINKSNTYENVKNYVVEKNINNINMDVQEPDDKDIYTNNGKIILGVCNIQNNDYSTKFIYSLKKQLELHQKSVLALELDKRNFIYYRTNEMESITSNNAKSYLSNNLNYDVILIDSNNNIESYTDDAIYLLDPSIYEINKLLYSDRMIFQKLQGKKIIFINSLLTEHDVEQFAKEANISVYYNLPPLNDRKDNNELDKLLAKLGIINEINNKSVKKGLFDIFK